MTSASTHQLTEQQRAFASSYVLGEAGVAGNGSASAIAAGYAEKSARQEGYRLLRHQGVRAEIDRLTREALGDHAVAAVSLLGKVIHDDEAPLKVRVDAAKTILDRAGYIAPKAADPIEPDDKEPRDMSIEDLMKTAARIRKEIEESDRQQAAEAASHEVH
jgi:phage terminase small subunit